MVPFWDPKWAKRAPKWHLKNSSQNRSILGPFWGPFWDPLATLGEKNRGHFLGSCQNGPQGRQKGSFWNHFGIHFGVILGPFWDPFLINSGCQMEQCGGLRGGYFRTEIVFFFLCRKGFTMVQTAGLMVYMCITRASGANGAKRANEANQPSRVNWAK